MPKHWTVKKVSAICKLRNGYPFDSKKFQPFGQQDNRLIRIRDLAPVESQVFTDESCPKSAWVFDGDLLIGMDGDFNIVRWAGGKAKLNQRVCALNASFEVEEKFVLYALPTPLKIINDLAYSTTVKHLSSTEVLKTQLALPANDEELKRIVACLDRETARIDALISKKTRFIELLREKRQALITHAVTKGLDPRVKMKDSRVEWLGEVPEHWDVKRLKFIATVQTGVAKGKDTTGEKTVEVPYLRVANVQDGYLDLSEVATIEITASDLPRYLLQPGDVLMNEGGDFDKLGRGHVWNGEVESCIHQNHVFAVRPHAVASRWLNTFTSSAAAQFYFMGRSKQSTNLASISSSNLMELAVPLPPDAEQIAILDQLASALVRVDSSLQKTERSIELLKERRSALITAAVTGQIDLREAA